MNVVLTKEVCEAHFCVWPDNVLIMIQKVAGRAKGSLLTLEAVERIKQTPLQSRGVDFIHINVQVLRQRWTVLRSGCNKLTLTCHLNKGKYILHYKL